MNAVNLSFRNARVRLDKRYLPIGIFLAFASSLSLFSTVCVSQNDYITRLTEIFQLHDGFVVVLAILAFLYAILLSSKKLIVPQLCSAACWPHAPWLVEAWTNSDPWHSLRATRFMPCCHCSFSLDMASCIISEYLLCSLF